MAHAYPDPVAKLLTLGKLDFSRRQPADWHDYPALGLMHEHVPQLVRMAFDPALNNAHGMRGWAPVHAVRALGQLRAAETAPELLRLLGRYEDNDWFSEDMRHAVAMMGPDTVPGLIASLGDETLSKFARMSVPECLEFVARQHPETRDACVAALIRQLERAEDNGKVFNGLIIASLIEMRAVEGMDAIRAAYECEGVEIQIPGDLEDTEIALGIRTQRETPRPHYGRLSVTDILDDPNTDDLTDEFSDGLFTDFPEVPAMPVRRLKIGRNDPCPCGSGRKYKKCCLL
ncbi:MAG: SEC-C metal-binding domain-containing protein [Alphaproteobacteria bacterium]